MIHVGTWKKKQEDNTESLAELNTNLMMGETCSRANYTISSNGIIAGIN